MSPEEGELTSTARDASAPRTSSAQPRVGVEANWLARRFLIIRKRLPSGETSYVRPACVRRYAPWKRDAGRTGRKAASRVSMNGYHDHRPVRLEVEQLTPGSRPSGRVPPPMEIW